MEEREYLKKHVAQCLTACMTELGMTRPADPVAFLAEAMLRWKAVNDPTPDKKEAAHFAAKSVSQETVEAPDTSCQVLRDEVEEEVVLRPEDKEIEQNAETVAEEEVDNHQSSLVAEEQNANFSAEEKLMVDLVDEQPSEASLGLPGPVVASSPDSEAVLETDAVVEEDGMEDGEVRAEADGEAMAEADGELIVEADGDVMVEADGDVMVEADGDVMVEADGEVMVEADGEVMVEADGEVIVEADGEVMVEADGEVIVEADGEVMVEADGEVMVEADGEVMVEADGQVMVEADGQVMVEADGEVMVESDGETIVEAENSVSYDQFSNTVAAMLAGSSSEDQNTTAGLPQPEAETTQSEELSEASVPDALLQGTQPVEVMESSAPELPAVDDVAIAHISTDATVASGDVLPATASGDTVAEKEESSLPASEVNTSSETSNTIPSQDSAIKDNFNNNNNETAEVMDSTDNIA